VAWFGRAVQPLGLLLLRMPPRAALVAGGVAWALAVGSVAALAWALQQALDRLAAPWLAAMVAALLLKPAMSFRMLHDEVAAVEAALQQSLDAPAWPCCAAAM
jgi:adenosylcobinamide-phosphate synthase